MCSDIAKLTYAPMDVVRACYLMKSREYLCRYWFRPSSSLSHYSPPQSNGRAGRATTERLYRHAHRPLPPCRFVRIFCIQSFIHALLTHLCRTDMPPPPPRDPSEVCDETIRTVQMVSDSLLLTERDLPLSAQSFSGCCDTIVAKTKQLAITMSNIDTDIKTKSHVQVGECGV